MAALARRFLAHCAEMNLPLSLSTSAGRGRIFISFLSRSSTLGAVRQHPPPPPASLELPEWGMGEIDGGEEEWRTEGGGGILQVATVSRSIEPLCCCTLSLPFTQPEEEELYLLLTRPSSLVTVAMPAKLHLQPLPV